MSIKVKTAVDTHCHMFTVADVPLQEIIERNTKHPFRMLMGAIVASHAVKYYREFIKFFDSETIQNVRKVTKQFSDALKSNKLGKWRIEAEELIVTPLIMDFDKNGKVEKFEAQHKRLNESFKEYKGAVKVLPFVGLDPRRIIFASKSGEIRTEDEIRVALSLFKEEFNIKSSEQRKEKSSLRSGDVIGVKIYPPLGFDVYPDSGKERNAYMVIYEWLAENDIPITAHCQKASFDLTKKNQLEHYTKPGNWLNVMGTNSTLSTLRLNLGHFGGESGVNDAIGWNEDDVGNDGDIVKRENGPTGKGWTSDIIKLLKKYDNTYADISAFDFGDEEAVTSLLWLLAYDKAGKFDISGAVNHKLESKLMWGSDYPMILDKRYSNYTKYFNGFVNTVIHRAPFMAKASTMLPRESTLPQPKTLLKNMVCNNPVKFLFD